MRDTALVSTLRGLAGRVDQGDGGARAEVLSGAAIPHSSLVVEPGRVAGLIGHPGFGLTRIGLSMLADHAVTGTVAYLDVRGWLCPSAAWESGITPERLVVVRCDDPVRWARVAATLIEGMQAVYAEVPRGVKDAQLRKLSALARTRRTPVILRPVRGDLPMGVTHLRLEAQEVVWAGPSAGHGTLLGRRVVLMASGKAMRGIPQTIEVEDHGAHALRVVPGLAAAPVGVAAG
jgi:hypothetical protein